MTTRTNWPFGGNLSATPSWRLVSPGKVEGRIWTLFQRMASTKTTPRLVAFAGIQEGNFFAALVSAFIEPSAVEWGISFFRLSNLNECKGSPSRGVQTVGSEWHGGTRCICWTSDCEIFLRLEPGTDLTNEDLLECQHSCSADVIRFESSRTEAMTENLRGR